MRHGWGNNSHQWDKQSVIHTLWGYYAAVLVFRLVNPNNLKRWNVFSVIFFSVFCTDVSFGTINKCLLGCLNVMPQIQSGWTEHWEQGDLVKVTVALCERWTSSELTDILDVASMARRYVYHWHALFSVCDDTCALLSNGEVIQGRGERERENKNIQINLNTI